MTAETLSAWARVARGGQGPYLLSWRVGVTRHAWAYRRFCDAWNDASVALSQFPVESMSLTDRTGRSLPFPAYATLVWRWGSEESSVVERDRGEARRRIDSLAGHGILEFVSLTSPLGRPLLTQRQFEGLRSRLARDVRHRGAGWV